MLISIKKYITLLKMIIKFNYIKFRFFVPKLWKYIKIRYRRTIAVIMLVTVFEFVILRIFPQMPSNNNAELYLLSAISQSLAAIFALVFTMTLVILRISYQFRGLLSEFFRDAFNIFYFALNVIAIILPFWILRTKITVSGIDICLVLASTCVLLTLPFFLRMKNFLEIQAGLRQLLQIAAEDIQHKDIDAYQNKLADLMDLMTRGLEEHEYSIVPVICDGHLVLSQSCFMHFGTTRKAVSDTIERLLVSSKIVSHFENAQNKMKDCLYNIARLPNFIPSLTDSDFSNLFELLSDIAHEKREVKQSIQFTACCCVWILSIKWLEKNVEKESYVRKKFISFMSTIGQKFVIDCCNNMDEIMKENWKYVFWLSNDEEMILERLKKWALGVNIKKSN